MTRNLFKNLFKYRPKDSFTPEENFVTESFAFLLQNSIDNNKLLFIDFINYIGISDISDYESVSISTQSIFETQYKLKAIPDIFININGLHAFIEVKISSDLNVYKIDNKSINQIELYQAIIPDSNKKNLYTLTKYSIDCPNNCPDFKKAILWSEVYDLINKNCSVYSNNFLIEDFLKFMEDLKMNTPKVTNDLSNSVIQIDNLLFQLERAILELNIPKSNSFGRNGFGYNLFQGKIDNKDQLSRNRDNPRKYFAWIGMKFNRNDSIVFQIWDNSVIKYLRTICDPGFEYVKGSQVYETNEFNFEKENYFCLSSVDQVIKLKEWLDKNMTSLQSLYLTADKINASA